MTPKNKTENLLYWGAALAVSILLAFLSGVATHWPESGQIDWRGVWLDVIQAVLTAAPFVIAGLGLPRLGKEPIANLVSKVGAGNARVALEEEADRQAGIPAPLDNSTVAQVVAAVKAEMLRDPEGTDPPRFLDRAKRTSRRHRHPVDPEGQVMPAIDPATPQGRATLDALDLPEPREGRG